MKKSYAGIAATVAFCGVVVGCQTRIFNQQPNANQDASDSKFVSIGGPVNEIFRIVGTSLKKNGEQIDCQESGVEIAFVDANPNERQNEVRLKCLSQDDNTIVHDERESGVDKVLLYIPNSGVARSPVTPDRDYWLHLKKGDCFITSGFREGGFGKKPIRANTIKVVKCPDVEEFKKSIDRFKLPEVPGTSVAETFTFTDVHFKRDQAENIICKDINILAKKENLTKSIRVHCDESPHSTLVSLEDASMLPFRFDVLQYYKNQLTFAHLPTEAVDENDHSTFNKKYNDVTSLTENLLALKTRGCKLEVRGKAFGEVITAASIVVKDCTPLE